MVEPSATPAAARLPSAGAYLRRRREAQRVSVEQVALLYVGSPQNVTAAIHTIHAFEGDRQLASETALVRLRQAFRFDLEVYRQLADGYGEPQLCRSCGCSWNDACVTEGCGCHWTADATLCSACAGVRAAA